MSCVFFRHYLYSFRISSKNQRRPKAWQPFSGVSWHYRILNWILSHMAEKMPCSLTWTWQKHSAINQLFFQEQSAIFFSDLSQEFIICKEGKSLSFVPWEGNGLQNSWHDVAISFERPNWVHLLLEHHLFYLAKLSFFCWQHKQLRFRFKT